MAPEPTVTLGEPGDLQGFPSSAPPGRLWRVCRKEVGSWWFSSDGTGRFDLEPPKGTCYLATDGRAAIREASRLGPVSTTWIGTRQLRQLAPPDPSAPLAATTHTRAAAYGVTLELVTVIPYAGPQRWAAAFASRGFAGLRHQLRHDARTRASGVSLFGRAGQAPFDEGHQAPLTAATARAAGVAVHPVPSAGELTILK
ncbi:MAG: RES domain-containing protein [Acidimicrobiales bacterium]